MAIASGIVYGLTAAILWGVLIVANKRYFHSYSSPVFLYLSAAFAVGWFLVGSALVGVPRLSWPGHVTPTGWGIMLAASAFIGIALVLLFHAISIGDVSYVSPISKLAPVFILPIEVVALDERLAPIQVAGIGLATAAVYIANYQGAGLLTPLKKAATYRPAQLALASSLFVAVMSILQRIILQDMRVQVDTWIGVKLAIVAILLAPLASSRIPVHGRSDLFKFAAAGLLLAAGEHYVGMAFAALPASIASPITSMQAIVAVILGGILLREQYLVIRLTAAVVAIGGVYLITIP